MDAVRYEERHWAPPWVVAVAFLVPFVLLFGVSVLASAGSDSGALAPWLGAVYGVVIGGLLAGFVWLNHSRRRIVVDDRALRIGSREPILLDEIDAARPISGAELRRVRGRLGSLDGAELGLPAAAIEPALGGAAVGGSMIAGRYRRAGMVSPPWMPSAALVVTHEGPTRVWLIGSRDADRLVAAIGAASGGRLGDGA